MRSRHEIIVDVLGSADHRIAARLKVECVAYVAKDGVFTTRPVDDFNRMFEPVT